MNCGFANDVLWHQLFLRNAFLRSLNIVDISGNGEKKKIQMGFFKVEDQSICTVRENDGSSQEVTQGWDYWHLNQECRPATSFKRLFFSHASIFLLSNLCSPMPLLTLLTVVTFILKFCPWAMKKFEGWSVHLASQ